MIISIGRGHHVQLFMIKVIQLLEKRKENNDDLALVPFLIILNVWYDFFFQLK
jgi:hypothetical protein